ncbi:MAG: type II toxin-antitoxin system RelB/DinJ family antitoxin [Endomicrobium sp.]|jgi:DNA-damage-inducible protein J|nr:type II toxin-antitoxin system RelB/DinJ family antitoxin [Endomicrobium sp.]
MIKTENLSIRVERGVKRDAENIFNKLGLSMSAAVNLFLNKSVLYGGIPFELSIKKTPEQIEKEWENKPHIPNQKTAKGLDEIKNFLNGAPSQEIHSFQSAEEMFASLEN